MRPRPRQSDLVSIDIAIEDDAWEAIDGLERLARQAIDTALAESGKQVPATAELSIVLCNDPFIADLNATWRGIAKPTNVLSFPLAAGSPLLGDIVIAYETVAREAAAEGKTLGDHLSHMIVHGFLHLLGFDHEDELEAEAMEALERRALAALGIASPYAEPMQCVAAGRPPP